MSHWKQSKEWEILFQECIIKAKKCPAIQLCSNNYITAKQIDNAAGNHVFDDNPEYWGITENQGHQIRSVFQHISTSSNEEFRNYIQDLIDNAMELEYSRLRNRQS